VKEESENYLDGSVVGESSNYREGKVLTARNAVGYKRNIVII
jgi:hypothetical protein